MEQIVTVEYYALDNLTQLLHHAEFMLNREGNLPFKTLHRKFGLKNVVQVVEVNGTRKRVEINLNEEGCTINIYQNGD